MISPVQLFGPPAHRRCGARAAARNGRPSRKHVPTFHHPSIAREPFTHPPPLNHGVASLERAPARSLGQPRRLVSLVGVASFGASRRSAALVSLANTVNASASTTGLVYGTTAALGCLVEANLDKGSSVPVVSATSAITLKQATTVLSRAQGCFGYRKILSTTMNIIGRRCRSSSHRCWRPDRRQLKSQVGR